MGISRLIYCKLAHKNRWLDLAGEFVIYASVLITIVFVACLGPIYHWLYEHKRLIKHDGSCWLCQDETEDGIEFLERERNELPENDRNQKAQEAFPAKL